MYSFFLCAFWQKRQKKRAYRPPSALRCEKPATKKCEVFKCKKTRALFSSYQYVVQFEKTRQKEWGIWSARASLFFSPHISRLCSSRQKEWRIRGAVLPFLLIFKCKNGGISELSLFGQAVWRVDILIRQFLSSKPNGAKFLKKTKRQSKESKPVA